MLPVHSVLLAVCGVPDAFVTRYHKFRVPFKSKTMR